MKEEKNKKIGLGIVGILVLVGAFYAGMTYGGNNVRNAISIRGATFGQNGANSMMRGSRNGEGFTAGQIISKDATSITVSLTSGGSKIIFLDTNTKISKQADGTLADLAVGTSVSVTGTPNADGSENAQSIQIRPTLAPSVLK